MKQNNTNKKRLITLLAVLGIGANFMFNAPSLSAQNTQKGKKPNKELRAMQRTYDSLSEANYKMFNIAQEKYYDRIDKKYTMRLFFSRKELAELNKVLTPYFQALAGETSLEYQYVKMLFPIKPDMPLTKFFDVIGILGVPDEELAPLDVICSQGHVYAFNDANKENNFECFLESFDLGKITDEGPDCTIKEFAQICQEWWDNQERMNELKRQIREKKNQH